MEPHESKSLTTFSKTLPVENQCRLSCARGKAAESERQRIAEGYVTLEVNWCASKAMSGGQRVAQ